MILQSSATAANQQGRVAGLESSRSAFKWYSTLALRPAGRVI